MTAFVRSTELTYIEGGLVDAPRGAVKPGDVLLAFQSADSGGTSGIDLDGGWQPLRTFAGGYWDGTDDNTWAGTKVWMRTVVNGEPEDYEAWTGHHQADGLITIIALGAARADNILVILGSNGSTRTPTGTPPTASGVVLRYVAGVPDPPAGDNITWDVPTGLTERAQGQGNIWTTSVLASATFASNAPVGAIALEPSSDLSSVHGLTVIVSSKAVVVPPDPPSFPTFAPARGVIRMQYRVHDALTGAYRGELRTATDVTMDRRDGEAGGFSAFCPMPSRRAADELARIIPRDPTELASGPGRLVVHPWRAGTLWGIYWLHTAEIEQSAKLGLGLRLQGTTLDGYMNSVSLEEDLNFGGDQIDNARALITHLGQDTRSNMGFTLAGGVSGVVRELAARQADSTTYGRVLRDYARVEGGFGYVINPTVDQGIERRWVWGSPRLDFPALKVTFTQARSGGEVTDFREVRSALRGGTRWGAVGGTPEGDATETREAVRAALIETPHLAAGWPIIDQRPFHPGASTVVTELDRYAQHYAATAAGAPVVFSANVILGRASKFHPNMIGGYVRFVMNNDWHVPTVEGGASRNAYQRLIGWSLTPATRTYGKDKLQLIVEQPGVGS